MSRKIKELSSEELSNIIAGALCKVLEWMPPENRSKAILIPDPRDETKLIAVHFSHDGLILFAGEGYDEFIKEFLCEECQEKLYPYAIIFTGINTETGEIDPDAYIGLYGAHDEQDGSTPLKKEDDVDDQLEQLKNSVNKKTIN